VTRQQLLVLWLSEPALDASVVAWAMHDDAMADDVPSTHPYSTAAAAVADGWRVIQITPRTPPAPGHEHVNSTLPNEFVLERLADDQPG
jgi:hypothetical protein